MGNVGKVAKNDSLNLDLLRNKTTQIKSRGSLDRSAVPTVASALRSLSGILDENNILTIGWIALHIFTLFLDKHPKFIRIDRSKPFSIDFYGAYN
jgi:hypothetical protein